MEGDIGKVTDQPFLIKYTESQHRKRTFSPSSACWHLFSTRAVGQVLAVFSQEWKADTPRDVRAQKGLCALIPCHYSYPSNLANKHRDGVWFHTETGDSFAFHSKDHGHESDRFRHRTGLSGDLKDGDCSLIINDITAEDAGPYNFRIEFDKKNSFSYFPATQLHVSDFTDKPTIFAPEIIEGKSCNITCTFNTTCRGTAPDLTWDNPTDVPGSVSNSVTQHGGTLTYSSVLTLVPSPKHYGQTLTCRVSFPSVSSQRTLALTVQYAPRNLSITSLDTIKDSSISTTEGNSTALHCSVESFPASNLRWEHLGVTVIRSSSNNEVRLELPHVTSRVAGEYRCVAENEHGAVESSITITVEHAPRNLSITSLDTIKDSSISITEGNSTALHCSVESFPASNLRWEHLGVTVNRSSSNNEVRLELPHVTSRVAGEYRCVAENEHGAVESSITITVERRETHEWKGALLGVGITLSGTLAGFLIYMCVRKGRNTGKGHSAQAARAGIYSPHEQSDKPWKDEEETLGIETDRYRNVFQADNIYENCNLDEDSIYANV
ncbi:sialic acid-binding Ig-like lectin 13 [Heptranchias perlo]|uniref:sialic acid-binding Ig-like lectin 13 n=1 Tax=Heptranchias perlo TaxID=212740 RepID=UPI0035597F3C